MKVKILNIDTLYVNEIINILNCDGICKVSNDKKITPNDFLNFCKKFLLITPLTKNDPDIIKVSKNTTFSTYDLPWHQEGSHYENNIISVTYNHENCQKFPTEFINTNTIVKEFCNDIDYCDGDKHDPGGRIPADFFLLPGFRSVQYGRDPAGRRMPVPNHSPLKPSLPRQGHFPPGSRSARARLLDAGSPG